MKIADLKVTKDWKSLEELVKDSKVPGAKIDPAKNYHLKNLLNYPIYYVEKASDPEAEEQGEVILGGGCAGYAEKEGTKLYLKHNLVDVFPAPEFLPVALHDNATSHNCIPLGDYLPEASEEDNYITKEQLQSELTKKADISAVNTKADKTYVDNQLALKADKTELDSYAKKEDLSNFLTDADLEAKAEKTYVDEQLALKADKTALANKADSSALALKADKTAVYTKTEVDLKLPLCLDIPIRELRDEVYEKSTILSWFDAADESELKSKISSDVPMFLKYGISLQTNPHYYKMPVEYVAFESATQIKLVFVGLDTTNDKVAKYELLMNLDGSILNSSSNIKLTLMPLEGEYVTEETLAVYATTEAMNSALALKADKTYVDEQLALKADKTELANKADTSALASYATTEALADKAEKSVVESLQSTISALEARIEALETPSP